ncbi:MAG: DUF4235 domain-containing protein [Actinomycetales bacterium]|jgi:hypothetical protein
MNLLFKLLGTGASLGAGFAATKLVDALWKKTTGTNPPKDSDNLEHSLRSALVFALVSGVVSSTIKVLTDRGTQKAIAKFNRTPAEV